MKKLFKTLAVLGVAGVAAAGVAAFSACGESGKTYNGEYHYNSYGHEYGVKVAVTVKEDKISKVKVVDSDYVSVSDPVDGTNWDQTKVDNWNNNLANLLKAYEGKTVQAIFAATSSISGVSGATENSVSESSLVITGATQGSARILLAVQDALKDLAE